MVTLDFGNKKYTMKIIAEILNIFQTTVETKENSAFRLACIRDIIEEFISQKTVKIHTINIEIRATLELYQGKNNATNNAIKIINHHNIVLRVRTFQIILLALVLFLLISLIEIAYNHKSARKAKIHK